MWNMARRTRESRDSMSCWSLAPISFNRSHCISAAASSRLRHQPVCSLSASENPTVRVATKYPHITMEYFNARGIPVEIIYLAGSIELAPLLGLADRIVDLVESGRTLKENGLEIVEVIPESSARLVVNRASYQTKRAEVLKFIEALNKATSCASSI